MSNASSTYDAVIILCAPSAHPLLQRPSDSAQNDVYVTGLGRWMPDNADFVIRATLTGEEIESVEADPSVVVWAAR